jgi:hypothetical protein
MQISQATKQELMLLIHGLRSIHVADSEDVRSKLAIQLETELSTRYGVMVGTDAEQERSLQIMPEYQSPLGSRNANPDPQ